jgi:hydroxyacylglutathione hydrolase
MNLFFHILFKFLLFPLLLIKALFQRPKSDPICECNWFQTNQISDFTIHTLNLGNIRTNCYLVVHDKGEGCIIDPVGNAPLILEQCTVQNTRFRFVLLTHRHYDHFGAVNEVARALNIPVYAHKKAIPAFRWNLSTGALFFTKTWRVSVPVQALQEGDILMVDDTCWQIMEAPGHTPDSILFWNKDAGICFTGDVIFLGAIGAVHFPSGSRRAMRRSLTRIISEIGDSVFLFPGHGASTMMLYERLFNEPLIRSIRHSKRSE